MFYSNPINFDDSPKVVAVSKEPERRAL